MGSIFGIISKQGNEIIKGHLPESSSSWNYNNIAFAAELVETSPDGNLKIVSDCRLDYIEELGQKLEIELKELDGISDGQLILMAYQKWGDNCVENLLGDFAFAIMDTESGKLFCARDHLGCRPFFYYEDNQYFLFSSTPLGFESIPGVNFLPRDEAILHLFNSKALPVNLTLYSGINKLAPAHSLVFSPKSRPFIKRYWDLEIDPEFSQMSYDRAQELFTKMLKEAVAQRIRKHRAFGVELSGGLDSSAVTSLAGDLKPDGAKLHAFTNALSDEQQKYYFPFVDEASYAKKVIEYVGADAFHIIEGVKERASLEALIRAMEISHMPLFQLFPAFSDQLLDKVEEQNLNLLLSGFGGDECITYSAHGILHEYANQGEWGKIEKALEGRPFSKKMGTKIKLFIEHRLFCGSTFLFKALLKKGQNRYRVSDLALKKVYKKPFLKLEKKWRNAARTPEYRIREQQRKRLIHESVSDRLENSYFQAQQRNIEYAYPLLDIKLLRLVYSLPAEYKNRRGLGRYLMREAMVGLLPEEIRMRTSKFGAAVPNIFYRFHLDRDEYLKLIDEAEQNNKFHYLDYDKLRWQIGKLMDQENFVKLSFGPRIFFSSISLLLLQKWKREGKMDTGIKC